MSLRNSLWLVPRTLVGDPLRRARKPWAFTPAAREEDGSAEGGGILKPAIVSRIGRRIVFDVDTARRLADGYQSSRK
jgi:hypothetical protein